MTGALDGGFNDHLNFDRTNLKVILSTALDGPSYMAAIWADGGSTCLRFTTRSYSIWLARKCLITRNLYSTLLASNTWLTITYILLLSPLGQIRSLFLFSHFLCFFVFPAFVFIFYFPLFCMNYLLSLFLIFFLFVVHVYFCLKSYIFL